MPKPDDDMKRVTPAEKAKDRMLVKAAKKRKSRGKGKRKASTRR